MTCFHPSPWRRLHQLNGPSGLAPAFSLGAQLNWKFQDVPLTANALGRTLITYGACIRLTFTGNLTSTAGTDIPRKVLTPMLVSSVQVQGTEIGTPISSSHMLGGIIDTDSYIRAGGRNPNFNQPGVTLAAATPKPFSHAIDLYFGNFSQKKGHQTCPLALFLQPGEIVVNTPMSLAAVDASLTDVSVSGMTVTASLVLLGDTEIRIANPWFLSRHKATAGSGADSIQIQSFGAASTLTGVQSKCGLHAVLWASSGLVGTGGSGTVANLTQFAADFLGLRQTNDIRGIVNEMFNELSDGQVIDTADTLDIGNPLYPLFDLQHPAIAGLDLLASAEFFPVLYPVREFDASKLLEAVGNPSYNLTGTFTPGSSHYTFVEGCYPFTGDFLNSLLAIIQRSHIGLELHKTDDLQLTTKMSDNKDPLVQANEDPNKLIYLPRLVVPRGQAAVK